MYSYDFVFDCGAMLSEFQVCHYFNTRHDSQNFAWTIPVAALGMITLAFVALI